MSELEYNNIDSTQPVYTLKVASRLSSTPTHSIRQYIDKNIQSLCKQLHYDQGIIIKIKVH